MKFFSDEVCHGGKDCCKKENRCGENEGDCDSDEDCSNGLTCGNDNCKAINGFGWDITDDCCVEKDKIEGM